MLEALRVADQKDRDKRTVMLPYGLTRFGNSDFVWCLFTTLFIQNINNLSKCIIIENVLISFR